MEWHLLQQSWFEWSCCFYMQHLNGQKMLRWTVFQLTIRLPSDMATLAWNSPKRSCCNCFVQRVECILIYTVCYRSSLLNANAVFIQYITSTKYSKHFDDHRYNLERRSMHVKQSNKLREAVYQSQNNLCQIKAKNKMPLTNTEYSKHLDDHEHNLGRWFVSAKQSTQLGEAVCLSQSILVLNTFPP